MTNIDAVLAADAAFIRAADTIIACRGLVGLRGPLADTPDTDPVVKAVFRRIRRAERDLARAKAAQRRAAAHADGWPNLGNAR